MSTRHLVDPALLPLIDAAPLVHLTRENLGDARAGMQQRSAALPRPRVLPQTVNIPADRERSALRLLLYIPPERHPSRAAILHMHGGGMISGMSELTTLSPITGALDHGVAVASVDYRLAPETVFPGPQQDCHVAAMWLANNAVALDIDPARIAVSGDSAGGGLAAALCLMARDEGGPRFAAQFLTYPMLDHRTGGADDPYQNPTTGEFMWQRSLNRFGWSALAGDYACDDSRVGWFSPARAADLSGLPPAWIATGTLDLFFDENLAYARRLCEAGVGVELHSYAGAVHAFNAIADASPARQLHRDFAEGLRKFLLLP